MPANALSDQFRVAVIIVNWNGGELLRRCLTALDRQTRRPDRVLVVDNASNDGSCDALAADFPDVELLRLQSNTGFAAANNLGIREATDCDWIALLNPDAFVEPAWLEHLVAASREHSDFAFFSSRLLIADDPKRLDGIGDVYHFSGMVWREGHGRLAAGLFTEPREVFSPCAAAALYRRDVFLDAGGFDEDYFCYVEDVDLGFRLRLRGHRCLYVPGAVVLHKGSALTGRRSDFSIYHGHRNVSWTFIKNVPSPWLWLFLPFHLAACVISLFWFTLQGNGMAIFKAKVDAIKGLARMCAKRRSIQAGRSIQFGRILPVLRFSLRRWKRSER